MSDTNQITVRGRVGTEPDVVVTTNGREMTKFRLGSTRSYRDTTSGEWRDTETEWFTVKTWGPAGQMVRQSIHRGMPVVVQGVLSSEEWESGERRHHTNVITAGVIAVDIKYGLVTFSKVTRQTPADNGQAAADNGVAADEAAEQPPDAALEDGTDDSTDAAFAPVLAEDPWVKSPIDA